MRAMANTETKTNWYALSVVPGREAEAAGLLGACAMAPRAEFEYVKNGVRTSELRPMLPGLVLLEAADPADARRTCRRTSGLADLRVQKTRINELSPEAVETFRALCGQSGVAAFSEATLAGGMRVLSGALTGRETLIGHVSNRRKCAYVPVDLGGQPAELELGLRVSRGGAA